MKQPDADNFMDTVIKEVQERSKSVVDISYDYIDELGMYESVDYMLRMRYSTIKITLIFRCVT